MLMSIRFNQARLLQDSGDVDAAQDAYRVLIREYPTYVDCTRVSFFSAGKTTAEFALGPHLVVSAPRSFPRCQRGSRWLSC